MSSQKNQAPYWRQISPEGYLVNLSDGTTEWYHVTDRSKCTFEPTGYETYLSASKGYLLNWTADTGILDEDAEEPRICTVRIRGLKWSEVFDIADYLEPGGGEDSDLNARGRALEKEHGIYLPTNYHYDGYGGFNDPFCLQLGFRGWLEDEGEYWPEDERGFWPETLAVVVGDGVEIEVVREDLIERVGSDWVLKERENPQNLYSPDGYLINPNTNDTIWWHFTPVHGLEAFNMRSFQVQPGSGMMFMGRPHNDLYSPHTATFFGGSPVSFYDRLDDAEILQVKIRLGENCRLFDARILFSDVPSWVTNEMERALRETEDLYEIEDALPDSGNEGSLSKEAFDYLMSQNLGETLNLWRQRFNAYRDMSAYSAEEFLKKAEMRDLITCYDTYRNWAAFSLSLWGLEYRAVQCVMNSYNHTKDEYPIFGEKGSYVGWLERESVYYGLDSEYDSINIAILHTSDTPVPYVDLECLEMTEIEIVSRERENPQNLPIYVNNLGVHTNAPIPLYHATTAADAIIEEGFKTPDELPRGSFGLGGSGTGLISMTGDPRYAEAICVHMATHARIGIGDLRWSDLMADFRRVSPKRYQAIVDGTDHGNKAANLIRVLKVMDKGQVPVNRGMFGEDMSLSLNPERYELVSMEEYVEYMREYCESKNYKHMIDTWTNPAKGTLADLYNELLWINDGTIENPVGDSHLWKRFLGKDLSILDQIAYVRADLNPDMRIVSRSDSVEMPSVFYRRSGEFSVDEYGVQKLKRGEDLNPSRSWGGYRAPTPLPESETGLTFDVDPEFVDRVPAEDYNKFAIFLFAEDEFRLPAPRDQLTPAVLEGTAMDILEVLPDLWQGKGVTCFYPHIGEKRKTLRDNLWS